MSMAFFDRAGKPARNRAVVTPGEVIGCWRIEETVEGGCYAVLVRIVCIHCGAEATRDYRLVKHHKSKTHKGCAGETST